MATASTEALSAAELAELEALLWEEERRGLVSPNFGAWLERARPEMRWDYRHLRHMQGRLDDVTSGSVDRLLLQVAGRHSKTEHVTSYAAYRLDLDPATRILFGTYSQQQANTVSRGVKRLAKARGITMDSRDAVEEWETAERGGFRAVGAGTGVASVNADLILIDDPIGSRAEAESQAHRHTVWDWMTTDILARCVPGTAVIFSMPRWHTDDPAGRMQDRQKDRWELVDLPGRAEKGDVLGREPGELLWPELRPEEWHQAQRTDLGEYGYASFILCRPRPREGGMFQWDWWQLLSESPKAGRLVRYWDTAGTEPKSRSHDPDYTAGALMCRMEDRRTCLLDVERFRASVARRDAKIEEVAKKDREKYGDRVTWWFEEESGIAGTERTAAIVRRIQALGIACHTERATGSKELRAEPLASAAESGNVLLGPGPWRDPFREEAAEFPGGAHDDQVDAASGALAKVSADRPVHHTRTLSPWG